MKSPLVIEVSGENGYREALATLKTWRKEERKLRPPKVIPFKEWCRRKGMPIE